MVLTAGMRRHCKRRQLGKQLKLLEVGMQMQVIEEIDIHLRDGIDGSDAFWICSCALILSGFVH